MIGKYEIFEKALSKKLDGFAQSEVEKELFRNGADWAREWVFYNDILARDKCIKCGKDLQFIEFRNKEYATLWHCEDCKNYQFGKVYG